MLSQFRFISHLYPDVKINVCPTTRYLVRSRNLFSQLQYSPSHFGFSRPILVSTMHMLGEALGWTRIPSRLGSSEVSGTKVQIRQDILDVFLKARFDLLVFVESHDSTETVFILMFHFPVQFSLHFERPLQQHKDTLTKTTGLNTMRTRIWLMEKMFTELTLFANIYCTACQPFTSRLKRLAKLKSHK